MKPSIAVTFMSNAGAWLLHGRLFEREDECQVGDRENNWNPTSVYRTPPNDWKPCQFSLTLCLMVWVVYRRNRHSFSEISTQESESAGGLEKVKPSLDELQLHTSKVSHRVTDNVSHYKSGQWPWPDLPSIKSNMTSAWVQYS